MNTNNTNALKTVNSIWPDIELRQVEDFSYTLWLEWEEMTKHKKTFKEYMRRAACKYFPDDDTYETDGKEMDSEDDTVVVNNDDDTTQVSEEDMQKMNELFANMWQIWFQLEEGERNFLHWKWLIYTRFFSPSVHDCL